MSLTPWAQIADLVRSARWSVAHVRGRESGSGFFLESPACADELLLVTNAHVVDAQATVVTYDDETLTSERISRAPEIDLAVVRFDRARLTTSPDGLPLRALSQVELGEPVIAIGSAYGMEGTVTSGVIAGLDRLRDRGQDPDGNLLENCLVTDALIGEGNSGGPLLGLDGRVVGVTVARHTEARVGSPSGFSYAIPASTVQLLLEDLGRGYDGLRRGKLGIRTEMREPTPRERELFGFADGERAVVAVEDPQPGEPSCGIVRRGDLLLELDGQRLTYAGQILALLDAHRAARTCELVVARAGVRQPPAAITPQPLGERIAT